MRAFTALTVTSTIAFAGQAFAGPDWLEGQDAGSSLSTAQVVRGVGELRSISGSLSDGGLDSDYEDMYLIRITDPALFRLTFGSEGFNGALWLFNVTLGGEAFGLIANDDAGPEDTTPLLTSLATDETGARISNPGIYAVACSASGRVPISRNGQIFFFGEDPTQISGPDGAGGNAPHSGWEGVGVAGTYSIGVEGATFVEVPTPGTALLGLVALAGTGLRRRRTI